MSDHLVGGPVDSVAPVVDLIDFRMLSDADRVRHLEVFDELITNVTERVGQLQASVAVAEWRAQVHDVLGGVSA
jgi:hypothetical protein